LFEELTISEYKFKLDTKVDMENTNQNTDRDTTVERRPKVGVVIGGGGLKCLAAVALFEFLNDAQIDIDLLVGCSGGSIMAALRGAGYNPAQMRDFVTQLLNKKLFRNIDYRSIAGIAKLPLGRFDKSSGILKKEPFKRIYRRIFKDLRLEELQPETILQATDYQTGEGVVLSTGLVADAVYASGALFPILPPICIEGRWFVDGGYSSNVPVMEAVKRNMDVIIAVVLQEKLAQDPQGFFECFFTIQKTSARALVRSQLSLSIDLHHHEIVVVNVPFDKYIQVWDVNEVTAILDAGQKAVAQQKEEILSVIRSFQKESE
jgi:NTE family protein